MAETHIDIEVTRALLVRNLSDDNDLYDLNDFADAPFFIDEDPVKSATFIYPVEYDGIEVTSTPYDFLPVTPAGATLVSTTAIIKAYLSGGSQYPIGEDTSDWGYIPFPTKFPFLRYLGNDLAFSDIPDSPPSDWIVCGASLTWGVDEGLQDALFLTYGDTSDPHVIVTNMGWRFTYELPPPPSGAGDLETRRHFEPVRRG